jgi:hypothetical protein
VARALVRGEERVGRGAQLHLGIAAQVEIESVIEAKLKAVYHISVSSA